jgi:mono/diheme cytochrome c family protein
MKEPSRLLPVAAVAFLVCLLAALLSARPARQPAADKIEQGRYLVTQVSLCGDCHTPHDEHGQPVSAQTLAGASIVFKPIHPVPNWAEYAPPLAGFPGFTDEQAITFLTTGRAAGGQLAAPPMPPYRFNQEDAAAVLAYLRSLKK